MATLKHTRKGERAGRDSTSLAARVDIKLDAFEGRHDFEHIAVDTDDPAYVTVVLSGDDGQSLKVMLPRAQVKKLLTWRMILSL